MRRKIKILRIITKLSIGGSSIHSILLTAHMDRGLFDSILIRGEQEKNGGDLGDLIKEKKLKPQVISELVREISLTKDIVAFWKLYRLIRKKKPDIVHTHSSKAGILARLAAKIGGVPIILHTFHGHVFHGYFGTLKSKIFLIIEQLLARISTRIIAVSPQQKKELVNLGISSSDKITHIYLGLELTPFLSAKKEKGKLRSELNINNSSHLVGIVGRLAPVKGHTYFLRACKKVLDFLPRTKFIIVGGGPLKKDMEELANQLNIKESVYFLGFRRDLAKIYSDLDLVVLSSLNEGTPVSVIEAMTVGKPVIATKVGGVVDIMDDGVNGMIVPPKNENALASAIVHLLKNPEVRKRLALNSPSKVYPFLNYTRLVKDMEELYKELIRLKYPLRCF